MNADQLWLMTAEASPLLATTVEKLRNRENILRVIKALRTQITPTRSALIMEMARLRLRAAEKFSKSTEMFFTTKGYEQATSENIARYIGSCFPNELRVLDVCCGIGGNLIGLGFDHEVHGVDKDPLMCKYAAQNAAVYGLKSVKIDCDDALSISWKDCDAFHVDPDRRVDARTVVPSNMHPSLRDVLARVQHRLAAIKLAPASKLSHELRRLVHREWIGERRESKQQVIWLARPNFPAGQRTATIVHRDGTISAISSTGTSPADLPPYAEKVGNYLYDPHSVVVASRLIDTLAIQLGAKRLAPSISYITSNTFTATSVAAAFRVIAVESPEPKRIAACFRAHDLGQIEWKKRGIETQAFEYLKKTRARGSAKGTVIATAFGGKIVCLICQRIPKSDTQVRSTG